jgi:hypothetical protein
MKTTRNILLALSLLGSAAGVASAQPSISAGLHLGPSGRASVDVGFFYDNLAPYGNWIQRPSYGWVWTPRQVSSSWRPYQDGHWVSTDQGWTWISAEPYGWATYHYGRWFDDPEIGWEWVPGTDWAPAWVSFQEGANYVGWAPLPPSFDINVAYNSGGYGFGGGFGLAPDAYVFVPERFFLSASLGGYIVPRERVVTFFGETRNYTSFRHDGDRIYNQGVPVEHIQRFVGHDVPRYQLADLRGGARGARIEGNRVELFRPQVQNVRVAPPTSRPAARQAVVTAEQFQANHPNRDARQAQVDRQRSYNGQPARQNAYQNGRPYNGQPQDRYQGQDRNGRQRTYNGQPQDPYQNGRQQRQYNPQTDRQYQQDQANRQRQYNPQTDRQYQQDQANRQRSYTPQRDRSQTQNPSYQQRPPRTDREYQRPPQQANPQQQADRNNQGRRQPNATQTEKDRQQQQRDRQDRENQDDPHRPPVRR